MYSCTSSKKNILKAFLVSRSIVNKPVSCKFCITGKQKHVILYEVFKTIWTLVHPCQIDHASPLVLH